MTRRSCVALVVCVGAVVVACASSDASSKAVSPSGSGGADFPESIGAARGELEKASHEVDQANAADCQAACKALASLERAANHLCMVAEPDECTDARSRLDRARRAITAQCGGC